MQNRERSPCFTSQSLVEYLIHFRLKSERGTLSLLKRGKNLISESRGQEIIIFVVPNCGFVMIVMMIIDRYADDCGIWIDDVVDCDDIVDADGDG